MASRDESPAPEEVLQEGTFCTLRLIKKLDGTEINRYPVDGEKTTFGRDETNDVRLYYADVSRFHCEIVFDSERRAQLNVLGTRGVEVNGRLVLPPTTIQLHEGDTFEVRKKRFSITFPTANDLVQIVRAEAMTPRRKRPSSRMSLIPKDLLVSPYAARDALADAARMQSPLRPFSRLATSHLPPAEENEPEEEAEAEKEIEKEMMEAEGEEEAEGGQDGFEEEDEGGENEEEEESMEEQSLEEEVEKAEDKENAQPSPVSSAPGPFLTPQPARSSQPEAHPTTNLVSQARLVHFDKSALPEIPSIQAASEEAVDESYEDRQSGSASEGESEEVEEADLEADEARVLFEPSDEEESDGGSDEASEDEEVGAKPSPPQTPRSLPLPASADTPYQNTPTVASSSSFASPRASTKRPAEPSTPSSSGLSSQTPPPKPITPSSLPLPDPTSTPYHAPPPASSIAQSHSTTPTTSRSPKSPNRSPSSSRPVSTPRKTPPRKAVFASTPKNLSVTRGPSSLRKAILLRSAKKVLLDEVRREELERMRRGEADDDDDDEIGQDEEEMFEEVVDAAQIALPDSPAPSQFAQEEDEEETPSLSSAPLEEDTLPEEADDDSDEEVERSLVEEEPIYEEDVESSEEEQEESEAESSDGEGSAGDAERSMDESVEDEEAQEVEEAAPPVVVASPSPALPSTPKVAPVSKTYYTPQVAQPDRRQELTRTMGPPVRVAASVSARGPIERLQQSQQSRPSLGSPIRAPKTRVVEEEEDVKEARNDAASNIPVEPVASRRDSSAIIASGPRALPTPSTIDFKELYSSPRKLMAPAPKEVDASSDEESTPLQGLAKKAELLRRKSLAPRLPIIESAATSLESPRRMSTPFLLSSTQLGSASPSQARVSTPAKPARSSPPALEQMDSPVATFSSSSRTVEPPTPDMSSIKHLYPSAAGNAATPRLGGLKEMFREATSSTSATPRFAGMRELFQTSAAETSTPRFAGVREMLKTPRQAPAAPLDAYYSSMPTLFSSNVNDPVSPDSQPPSGPSIIASSQMERQPYIPEDLYDDEPEQNEIRAALEQAQEEPDEDEAEHEEADRSRAETDDEGEDGEAQEMSREEEEAIEEPAVEISPKPQPPIKATRSRTRSAEEPVITLPPVRRGRVAATSSKASSSNPEVAESSDKPRLTRTRKIPIKAEPTSTPLPSVEETIMETKPTRTRTKASAATPAAAEPSTESSTSSSRLPTRRTRTTVNTPAAVDEAVVPTSKPTRSKRVPTPPAFSGSETLSLATAPPAKAIPRLTKRTTTASSKKEVEATPAAAPVDEPSSSRSTRTKVKAEPTESAIPPPTTSSRSKRNALATPAPKKTTRKAATSTIPKVSEEDKENSPETPAMPPPSTTSSKAKAPSASSTASKLPSRTSTRKAAPTPAAAVVEEEPPKVAATRSTRARK